MSGTLGIAFPYNSTVYTTADALASAMQAAGANVTYDRAAGAYLAWDGNVHTAFGAYGNLTSTPTVSSATYNLSSSTTPTDNFGRRGTATLPPLLVSFTNNTVSTALPIQLSFPAQGSIPATTFSLTLTNLVATSGTFNTTATTGGPNASCSGCNTGSTNTIMWYAIPINSGAGFVSMTAVNGTVGGQSMQGGVAAIYNSSTTPSTGSVVMEAYAYATSTSTTTTSVTSTSATETVSQTTATVVSQGHTINTIPTPNGESFYWTSYGQAPGNTGAHKLWGSEPVSVPSSGTATYSLYGNSTPTDNLGRVGSLNSASMTVNFTSQTMTANTTPGLNIMFPASGNLPVTMYQMSINNVPINNNYQMVPTTCVGCSSSSASGSVNLGFAGANGQAVLGAIAVWGSVGATAAQPHVGAAAAVWAKPN